MQEIEAQKWIEAILNEPFPIQYEEALKDGVILCRVMNTLSPGTITKINTSGASFKLMENISRYILFVTANNQTTNFVFPNFFHKFFLV